MSQIEHAGELHAVIPLSGTIVQRTIKEEATTSTGAAAAAAVTSTAAVAAAAIASPLTALSSFRSEKSQNTAASSSNAAATKVYERPDMERTDSIHGKSNMGKSFNREETAHLLIVFLSKIIIFPFATTTTTTVDEVTMVEGALQMKTKVTFPLSDSSPLLSAISHTLLVHCP